MNSPFTREQQAFARSIEQINKALNAPKQINWEQRRYEIARDIYANMPTRFAETAVKQADELIEALKKNNKNPEE